MCNEHVVVGNKRAPVKHGFNRVYVGRPSLLGNPFPLNGEANREKVIQQYAGWLKNHVMTQDEVFQELFDLAKRVDAGEKLELTCWCAPKACHADIIKIAVLWLSNLNSK